MTIEPVNMSEKKYLLTESDIRQIKDLECGWCVDNAGGHFNCADASKAEQKRLLEANEYREHTCRDDGRGVFRCSECGAFAKRGAVTDLCREIPIRYCPNCGAKVVS